VNIQTGLTNIIRIKIILITGFILLGCGAGANHTIPDIGSQAPEGFSSEKDRPSLTYSSSTNLEAFKGSRNRSYLLGSGDLLEIQMEPKQEEINGEYKISPDGTISIYLGGELNLGGLNLREAEDTIKISLAKYYDIIALNLKINYYNNNKVFVLGRVESPGAVELTGHGTILEVLAQAGPLPPVQESAFLSRCAIIRGSDQIIWIDLQELLQRGNVELNLPLNNNDILYIPDPEDANVFVMGEVDEPGSYPIKNELSLLTAIGLAGGPTEDAVTSNVQLIRDRGLGGGVITINLDEVMQTADFSQNYMLKRNDIIFVPKKGIAKFNYYLRQINPFVDIVFLGRILFP
jgi:polysaccharide export outer membrane protein